MGKKENILVSAMIAGLVGAGSLVSVAQADHKPGHHGKKDAKHGDAKKGAKKSEKDHPCKGEKGCHTEGEAPAHPASE